MFNHVITTLNLINRYLYDNSVKTSFAVFAILLIILLANTGLRLVEDVNHGDIPSVFLIQLLLLKVIQYSPLIIPLSLFLGIIISLNRLYASNEMIIIKLNGYSNIHVTKVLLKLIIIVTIVLTILKFFLSPLAVDFRSQIEHQILHEQKIYSLKEGSFNISNDRSKVVYINDKSTDKPANIFIKSYSNTSTRIDISSGVESNSNNSSMISLKDGISYILNSDGSFSSTKYVIHEMALSDNIPELINNDMESKSIYQLYQIDNLEAFSEMINRLSVIISTIILSCIAIPLSSLSKTNDKYKNIFYGIIIYFIYVISINIFTSSAVNELFLSLSIIILHAIYFFISYLFYKYSPRTLS